MPPSYCLGKTFCINGYFIAVAQLDRAVAFK